VLRFQLPEVLLQWFVAYLLVGFFFFFFSFFFFFLFFFNHIFIVKVQEVACSARYGVKKTLISNNQKTKENFKIISKSCQVLDTSPTHG